LRTLGGTVEGGRGGVSSSPVVVDVRVSADAVLEADIERVPEQSIQNHVAHHRHSVPDLEVTTQLSEPTGPSSMTHLLQAAAGWRRRRWWRRRCWSMWNVITS